MKASFRTLKQKTEQYVNIYPHKKKYSAILDLKAKYYWARENEWERFKESFSSVGKTLTYRWSSGMKPKRIWRWEGHWLAVIELEEYL